jgi:predicted phosphodiesterase
VVPDVVVHGGDLAANGARPAEVVDIIHDLGWPGVRGNTDEMLWRPELLPELELKTPSKHALRRVLFQEIAPVTCELLGPDRLAWLQRLSSQWCGGEVTVLHASPGNLWRAPLGDASNHELLTSYGEINSAAVVYGHIHRPFIRRVGSRTIANSGSVGLSYDGDRRASYVVLDESGITIRRVEYEIEREVQELRSRRYPRAEWLVSMLMSAKYEPPI